MATTLVNSALGYVFWVIGARLFPPATVGIVAALIAAGSTVGILAYAGVGMTLIHSLPQARDGREWSLTLQAGLLITLLLALGGALLVVGALPVASMHFGLLRDLPDAAVFIVGTATWSLGSAMDYAFIAERRAHLMLARNAIHAVAKLVLVGLIVWLAAHGPTSLLLAWSGAALVGAVTAIGLLFWRLSRGRLAAPGGRALLARAAHLRTRLVGHQLISISGQLPPLLLPILVTTRLSPRSDAYFYLTWLLTGVLLVVSAAVADALFTEGAYRPDQLGPRAWFALKLVGAVVLPLMTVFLVGGGLLLSIFGPGYAAHALSLLRWLAVAAIPDALTNLYVAVLRVKSRFRTASILNLSMGTGSLAAAWVLLPLLGITGAGVAWLSMQVGGSLVCGADVLRHPLSPGATAVGRAV